MEFSEQEIQQLNTLLLSPDEANKQIALGLIQNAPENIPALKIALCITAYLSKRPKKDLEGRAHDLLVEHLSEQEVTTLQNQIIILDYAQYKFKVTEGWNTFQNPLRKFLSIHEEAIPLYWPLFLIYPEPYSKIYTLLANRIQKEWNNYNKALFFYEKAIALDSNNTKAKFGFALLTHTHYIQKGKRLEQVDKVLEFYMAAYKGPQNINAYKNAAMLCRDVGDIERAVYYYNEGIQHYPKDAALLNNYAFLLLQFKQDYTKAKKLAEQGLEITPFDPCLLDTLAHIEFMGFQNFKRAQALFEKALEKDGQHHYSHTGLGDMYVALQQYELAEHHYLQGLHDGLQYTSREVSEVIEKLEKLVVFYSAYLINNSKADFYQLKLSRLRPKR